MKLTEILKVPPQESKRFELHSFDLNNGKVITNYENKDIWLFTTLLNKYTEMYAIKDKETIIACVVVDRQVVFNTEYLIIGRTWVDSAYRKKGLASTIYLALVKKLKQHLLSDKEQTPEISSLWKKLSQFTSVKVLDTKNGNILQRDDVPDEKLYDGIDNYRLVMEYQLSNIPQVGDNILEEYIVVTHAENFGKYD